MLAGQLVAQLCLDIGQQEGILLAGKADGGANGAGTAGTTNAVHIVIGFFRQGVVDHMGHVLDVQTTTRHISGDQHLEAPFLETVQGLDPLVLGHFTGQQAALNAIAMQVVRQPTNLIAPVTEHDDTLCPGFGDQVV